MEGVIQPVQIGDRRKLVHLVAQSQNSRFAAIESGDIEEPQHGIRFRKPAIGLQNNFRQDGMRPNRGDASEIILDIVLKTPSVRAIFPVCRKHVFLETCSREGGTLAFQARRVRIDEASRQYWDDKAIA